MGRYWSSSAVWLVVILIQMIMRSQAAVMSEFTKCCHYCRSQPDMWHEVNPAFNLVVGETEVTDFSRPAAYVIDDVVEAEPTIFHRSYSIRYAGAPVFLQYYSIIYEQEVLAGQYLQVDLTLVRDVTAVATEGGFYEDVNDELFDRHESWVTKYAVSYSTSSSSSQFSWVREHGTYGGIMVFDGNSDVSTPKFNSFQSPVVARFVRFHPLTAFNRKGATDVAMMRVSVVTCTTGDCVTPQHDCEVDEWGGWGQCECNWEGCFRSRVRIVLRQNSCGGGLCAHTSERETCVLPEPLWQTILKYSPIGIVVLIIIIVITVILIRKHKKKKEKEMFKKQQRQDNKRTFKQKKKKGDKDEENVKEEDMDEKPDKKDEVDDFIEKEVTQPVTSRNVDTKIDTSRTEKPSSNQLYQDKLGKALPPPIHTVQDKNKLLPKREQEERLTKPEDKPKPLGMTGMMGGLTPIGQPQPKNDPFGPPKNNPFGPPKNDPFGPPKNDPFGPPKKDEDDGDIDDILGSVPAKKDLDPIRSPPGGVREPAGLGAKKKDPFDLGLDDDIW